MQLNKCEASPKRMKCVKAQEYQKKKTFKGKSNMNKFNLTKLMSIKEGSCWRKLLPTQQVINQQEHLSMFDSINNGGIEEQGWAQAKISKLHKSMEYTVSQCAVCKEAWPLKSKARSPYAALYPGAPLFL